MMAEILFLTVDEIIEIHRTMIELFGGSGGIRDQGLLESAVHAPQSSFDGKRLHEDIFEMAAAYLFHLVQNHAFVDGNKRVGAAAGSTFLKMNGFALQPVHPEFDDLVLGVARGDIGQKEIAVFLREHSIPVAEDE